MFVHPETIIKAQRATPENFRNFGYVIKTNDIPPEAANNVVANQGTAIKQEHVGVITNDFSLMGESSLNIHIFNCKARELSCNDTRFHCRVMEKHTYSSQVFIPKTAGYVKDCYLVIVAKEDYYDDAGGVEAFIFDSESSVVYNPDVWHSPMCNIQPSKEILSFVVMISEMENGGEMNCVETECDFYVDL